MCSESANEDNMETAPAPCPLKTGDILSSKSTQYMVLDFNGEGCFSDVVRCVDLTTKKLVAIKVHKDISELLIQHELKMLKAVRALDPDKNNIAEFMDYFKFNNFSCLVFEMLDKSLWDLMNEKKGLPFSLNEIRPVAHQLFVALEALEGIGILHTDLKPDNVMLVNHKDQPFRVKLIDFGLAGPVSKVQVGMEMQPLDYRAPEVTLGLPLSEAIDMWGVGCILSFLYFAADIFSGDCAYHRMKAMVHMLGQPEDHVLSAGLNTFEYFSREEGSLRPRWRLKLPGEYKEATGLDPKVDWGFFDVARNLEDAVQNYPDKSDPLEYKDRMEFLSLLKSCLHMDAGCRVTPREALKHPFITMAHLVDDMGTSSYADDSRKCMAVSTSQNLDESDDSLTNTETDMELRGDQTPSQSSNCGGVSGTNSSSGEDKDIDNSSDKDNVDPRESCINLNEDSSPTVLSGSSTSSDGHSDAEISNSTGPSVATDISDSSVSDSLYEGVRDTTTPTKEESGDAASSKNGNTHTDHVPVISGTSSTTNDDRPMITVPPMMTTPSVEPVAAGSTDGVEVEVGVEVKKKKKNVFQRTCKFFSRLKKRVVSIFKPRQN